MAELHVTMLYSPNNFVDCVTWEFSHSTAPGLPIQRTWHKVWGFDRTSSGHYNQWIILTPSTTSTWWTWSIVPRIKVYVSQMATFH